ncbi:hypothetical protein ID854_06140 [Xenorhabdus sp. M]|uniref:Uncharacterized protein n=1 Tax=Xenorhabdus szentirmaii TaxID=290112 RepID=A0AAW3YPT8_9GAMM|nr:hypothetical protein [Xenorhabdus sp. M]MBD2800048.1 hypothetical protein [Xenorhabdus sp. M]
MNKAIDFYMEPMMFFRSTDFLSGYSKKLEGYESINCKENALKVFFAQDLPEPYMIWSDFFSDLISQVYLHKDYEQADKNIPIRMNSSNEDDIKSAIRKRKLFLARKKQGFIDNIEYNTFLAEVSDECHYILHMISLSRYLFPLNKNTKLEEIFSIFKKGLMPCGITKDKKIVVFNPQILRMNQTIQ